MTSLDWVASNLLMADPDPVQAQGPEDGQHDDLLGVDSIPLAILSNCRRYSRLLNQYTPAGLQTGGKWHYPKVPFAPNWPK